MGKGAGENSSLGLAPFISGKRRKLLEKNVHAQYINCKIIIVYHNNVDIDGRY